VPQKTNSDLIREITATLQTVDTRVDALTREFDYLRSSVDKYSADAIDSSKEVVALTERVTELKRVSEETDRKRWQLTLAVIAALIAFVLSLVANLILSAIRK
jgi:hypothetical protein